jgi:hypothetical protein
VQELRAVLLATGASDAKMEEGSMRVDANVSVRPAGSDQLGTRCEIKNLNSTRSLVRAIEYEARRQVDLLAAGERIVQQTRHWDEADGRTHTLRSKEEADDYRYFPEPDLVPLAPRTPGWRPSTPPSRCCLPSGDGRWPSAPAPTRAPPPSSSSATSTGSCSPPSTPAATPGAWSPGPPTTSSATPAG